MREADVRRVSWLVDDKDPVDNQRLLIEILDCLRRIDDRLERFLEAGRTRARP
jgi:hypothetical protein